MEAITWKTGSQHSFISIFGHAGGVLMDASWDIAP